MVRFALAAAAALCSTAVLAHPGEPHDAAKRRRDLRHNEIGIRNAEITLAQCKGSAAGQALERRAVMRRAAKAAQLREKRGLEEARMLAKRDQEALDEYLQTCHDRSDAVDWDATTPHGTVFASNATVGLAPETIIGPYWVGGEAMRSDVAEGQGGVPVHLELQFVDVATCAAVEGLLVDVWHANATGVYSGVVAGAGLDSTFLRGVQASDADGVAAFDTVFPGHYQGRVNHIHVTSNQGARRLANGTYAGGRVNHIGQLYFDQELINAVEAMPPYSANAMRLTYTRDDFLAAQQASRDYDPLLDYVMLSEDPADGLLMWATIGINSTADQSRFVSAGAWHYKDGGVDTSPKWNFTIPPGGFPFPTGGFPPGVTPPPGGFPPFPTQPGAPTTTKQYWSPCMKKKKEEEA
ncbi:Intradiol ring-cleavage dioxygenase [Biscogniauxia sp. FL1348]|nr:Intradiol ring-cleavage dioxygenase [Biscogniauxia sp. FL1348]